MQIDIIITVILFVVALLRPQSKGVAVLIFALMWSLWGWNTWNGDYEAYAEIFINPNFATSELGYTILNKFIGLFTDDYQVFVIIISFMLLSSILYCSLITLSCIVFSYIFCYLFRRICLY